MSEAQQTPETGTEETAAQAQPQQPDPFEVIVALQAEVATYKDQALRALAEAENTRRRAERDREDASKYAVSGFARDLLSVADNLRRALDAVAPSEDETVKALVTGVEATERELLEAEFASREFTPTVQAILSVSTFSTPSQWTVSTDRGETRFILRTEEDIRRLAQGRLLISSSHGIQFQVPDRFALDRQSKKLLERFL